MVDPVSCRVLDKRNVTDITHVNVIVQTEKNTQASLGENCVCGFKKDVILGDIPS
jgi:hypothetical protein